MLIPQSSKKAENVLLLCYDFDVDAAPAGAQSPCTPPPLAAKNITNDNTNQSLSLQLPGLTRQHVSYCLSRLTVQLSEPHSLSLFVIGEHPFI